MHKAQKSMLIPSMQKWRGWILKYQNMPKLSVSNALNTPKLLFHTEMHKNDGGVLKSQNTPKLLGINIQMTPQELVKTQMQKY